MRPIHLAHLDRTRPVLVLTRELVRAPEPGHGRPITGTVRGLSTEIPVGRQNGLDHDSVVSCDNILTILVTALGRQVGLLLESQEAALTAAIHAAFDLD